MLTSSAIDALPAGRELDALVAEQVMGWECVHRMTLLPKEIWVAEAEREFEAEYGTKPPSGWAMDQTWADYSGDHPPKWCEKCQKRPSQFQSGQYVLRPYSTSIGAAWEVVEKLNKKFHLRLISPFEPGEPYFAGFSPHGMTGWDGRPHFEAGADTAPLAICRAALKAVAA